MDRSKISTTRQTLAVSGGLVLANTFYAGYIQIVLSCRVVVRRWKTCLLVLVYVLVGGKLPWEKLNFVVIG